MATSPRCNKADSSEAQVDLPGSSAVEIGKSVYSSLPQSYHNASQEQQQERHNRLHEVMDNNPIKEIEDVCLELGVAKTPQCSEEPLAGDHQSRRAHSGGEPTAFGHLFNKPQVSQVEGHHFFFF